MGAAWTQISDNINKTKHDMYSMVNWQNEQKKHIVYCVGINRQGKRAA